LGKGVFAAFTKWLPRQAGVEPKHSAVHEEPVANLLHKLWNDEQGQDIAEYAVMLAVILVIVVGTIRLIGSNANNVFSQVGSAIQ
jgi:Flp pilus assembly pilin Flp